MSNALTIIAQNTGVSHEEVVNVLKGMIVSAKNQHNAIATDAELAVVSSVCAKYDLNPLVKECAAFVSGGKLQMIVMIDGWYRIVNRQQNFDGVTFDDKFDDNGKLFSTTCNMYIKDRSHPVSVTEYMEECFDIKSSVWKKWPARMIRHKAYIQAARMAFGFSEIIDDDEAARYKQNATKERDVTPQQAPADIEAVKLKMANCNSHAELDEVCANIRKELELSGQFMQVKGDLILFKRENADRIDNMQIVDIDTGEILEVEFEQCESQQ